MKVVERINEYLYTGGLFNPELADHDKVRMLILDCRDYIEQLEARLNNPTDCKGIANNSE